MSEWLHELLVGVLVANLIIVVIGISVNYNHIKQQNALDRLKKK
jgi:hypothetical protein